MDDLKRKSSKKENCLNAGDCIVNEAKSILINNLNNVEKKLKKKKQFFSLEKEDLMKFLSEKSDNGEPMKRETARDV